MAQLFVYDLATRAPAWRTAADRWSAVLDWSPDSSTIATGGSQSGDLKLWEAQEGVQLSKPVHASAGFLQTVGFVRDGSLVVTAGSDGTVRLYDSATLKQVGATLPAIESHSTFAFPLPGDQSYSRCPMSGVRGSGPSILHAGRSRLWSPTAS